MLMHFDTQELGRAAKDRQGFNRFAYEIAAVRLILFTRTDEDYSHYYGGLQINLAVEKCQESFKIEVKGFNDLNIVWLNKIYREYEGQMWTRCATTDDCNRTKFNCLFCSKVLCSFSTLRNHLNMHLQIYPFKCYACEKKYTSSSSLCRHRIKKHAL